MSRSPAAWVLPSFSHDENCGFEKGGELNGLEMSQIDVYESGKPLVPGSMRSTIR